MNTQEISKTFTRPQNLFDSLSVLNRLGNSGEEYLILAGGTDLLVKHRYSFPAKRIPFDSVPLVDITAIRQLKEIKVTDASLNIGALVTHADIADSKEIRRFAPILAAAAGEVGSPQIRNRGTIGGNICNASPAADLLSVLTAMDAELEIACLKGQNISKRSIPMTQFISGPFASKLHPGELLVSIAIPLKKPQVGFYQIKESGPRISTDNLKPALRPIEFWGSGYTKLGKRNAMSISILNISLLLGFKALPGGKEYRVTDSCLCVGAVTPCPTRFTKTENLLKEMRITDNGQIRNIEKLEAAAHLVVEEMKQLTGIRKSTPYKSAVLLRLLPALVVGVTEAAIKNVSEN